MKDRSPEIAITRRQQILKWQMYEYVKPISRCTMKDKDLTKQKLIDAVGELISTKGYSAIRISKVAQLAGVDRKLVYRYFGNLENLVEAYVTENDYWMLFAQQLKTMTGETDQENLHAVITDILQQLFKFFIEEPEMQDLILMELSGTNPLMRSIHNVRESIGQDIFRFTDEKFKDSTVNFRAVSALLVGGIYYIVLHTRKNGYAFADMDMRSKDGMNAIFKTIEQIIDWSFKTATSL